MDHHEMPDDLQVAVARFADAVAAARIQITYSDLDLALPRRELDSREIEAALSYLRERGVELSEDS